MKTKKLAAMLAAAGLSASAFATNGYFAHGVGIKAKAMGGAGIAYAEDGFGIGANPATLAQAEQGFAVGATLFQPDRSVRHSGEWKDGNQTQRFVIPEFAYARHGADAWSYGVAVYGNGGMNTDYGRPIYDNTQNTYSNLEQLFIAPTVAKRLNERHTVAVSLNLVYQTFDARGLGNFQIFTPGNAFNPGDKGKDTSTGIGIKLGWTGQVTKDLALGAFFQPRTRMSRFDKYRYLFAEHGRFDIPASYGAGLAFAATPKTTLLLDVVQIEYGKIKALANPNNYVAGNTQLGEDDGKGFGWKNMTVYKLGVRHQYDDKTILRAGWNYGRQPIPGSELDFNLLAPAVIENHMTLGLTRKLDNGSDVTVHYMHAFNKEIGGSGAGTNAVSALKMKQNEIGVQYSWKY